MRNSILFKFNRNTHEKFSFIDFYRLLFCTSLLNSSLKKLNSKKQRNINAPPIYLVSYPSKGKMYLELMKYLYNELEKENIELQIIF